MVLGPLPTLGGMWDDYQARLQWAMAEAKETISTLHPKLGISYQAMKKVVTGGTKRLASHNHTEAARLLKVDPRWLATGEGTPHANAAWPLSHELLAELRKADANALRRAENAARAALDMDPAPKQETPLAA